MSGIEIVNQVPEPTCPEHGARCPAPKVPGTECCWQALVTKAHDEQDRLSRILREAREVLNGGESSEATFVADLEKYLKHNTERSIRLREDVGNWQKRAETLRAERDQANHLLVGTTEALNRVVTERDRFAEANAEPVPMILHCPECTERHIDAGDFAEKPHHTHACQACGVVWRPAVVATVGVRFLPGFRDADVAVASSRFGMSTAGVNGDGANP